MDHIIPVAYGGTDDLSNLRAARQPCNSARGALRTPRLSAAELAPVRRSEPCVVCSGTSSASAPFGLRVFGDHDTRLYICIRCFVELDAATLARLTLEGARACPVWLKPSQTPDWDDPALHVESRADAQ